MLPASYTGGEPGQPWTATMHTLQTLLILGLDPASASARRAIGLVAENGRWEHAGQRFFDGEVEPCINGRTIETGAYFGVDVVPVVERILAGRLADGGWNCEAENGSVRSSFDTTINVLSTAWPSSNARPAVLSRCARPAAAVRSTCSSAACSAARARWSSSSRHTWSSRSSGRLAALHLDCLSQGGGVRARWPRSGTGDIAADR
jgi:hypothetical protein